MKRIFLIMLVIVCTIPALAQQQKSFFEQLTENYASKDGFSASMLTRDMFDLYMKKRNLDKTSPVSDALKNLDYIMVVSQSNLMVNYLPATADKITGGQDNQLHKTILDHYQKNNFTLFKTEKRMGEDVKVYLKKNQNKIESLALVTSSSSSTNLVELKGDIDLKTVAELNKELNLKGLENLYKLDDSNAYYGRTTGLGYSREKIEELAARQREMVDSQRTLTDEQRAQFEKQVQLQAKKQLEMAEKYREMAEKYKREPIFLNYPGDTNTVYYIDGKKVKAKEIKELDKDRIESVEIKKSGKEDDKTTIRIKTK